MQVTRTRATNRQEQLAHAGAVRCIHIGRKSGSVYATGGEDKKVNIWSLGRPNAIASLAGHTSPVECVSFDSAERTVIAGSTGGTLKLWDLEQAKVARTLTGHRSNCIAVQWHPYGEFFASGSVDTNLKIWDIRRKACIQTYKGHAQGVRQIIFSPDGRWVFSGGDDGVVRLWDLTMGKLMHEFTQQTGAINALAIHPTEFLMASASSDKTIRLWDLERFEQISTTPAEIGQVRRIAFSDDGQALLSGVEESLRVWGWEPVRCFDQTEVRWNRLADMTIGPDQQLLAGSMNDAMVTMWSVDLNSVRPFGSPKAAPVNGGVRRFSVPKAQQAPPPPRGRALGACSPAHNLHVQAVQALPGLASPQPPAPHEPPPRVVTGVAQALQQLDVAESDVAGVRPPPLQPQSAQPAAAAVGASPGANTLPPLTPLSPLSPRTPLDVPAAAAEAEHGAGAADGADAAAVAADPVDAPAGAAACVGAGAGAAASEADDAAAAEAAAQCARMHIANCRQQLAAVKSQGRPTEALGQPPPVASASNVAHEAAAARPQRPGSGRHKSIGTSMGDSIAAPAAPLADAARVAQERSAFAPAPKIEPELPPPRYKQPPAAPRIAMPEPPRAAPISSHRQGPIGLDPAAFMQNGGAAPRDDLLLRELLGGSAMQVSVLTNRLTALRVLSRFWAAGDVKQMLSQLLQLHQSNPAITVDVLRAGPLQNTTLDLVDALTLLPLLQSLLASQFEEYTVASIEALAMLLRSFGSLIATTYHSAHEGVGVDLSMETRYERCKECYTLFEGMRAQLHELARQGSRKHATPAAKLLSSMVEVLRLPPQGAQ